jgi:hypothetical protein
VSQVPVPAVVLLVVAVVLLVVVELALLLGLQRPQLSLQ